MAQCSSVSPSVLLLGCGYTLSEVARRLGREVAVCTTQSSASAAPLRAEGYLCYELSIDSSSQIAALIERYPSISTIVDSVPPLVDRTPRQQTAPPIPVGPLSVLDAVGSRDIRIIYLSTTGVYGERDGGIVTEDTPPHPRELNATARYASEQTYAGSTKAVCLLRIAGIYGPGRNILDRLRAGTHRVVAGVDRWTNRIHVSDLAVAITNLVGAHSMPRLLNVSDGNWLRTSEVLALCSNYADFPPPLIIQPEDAHHTMLSHQRVDSSLLRRTILPQLQFPTLESFLQSNSDGS